LLKGMVLAAVPDRWEGDPFQGNADAPGWGRREHDTVAGRHDHELRARVVTWPPLRLARLRCERGSVDVVRARVLPNQNEEEACV
jgi:hypothetical protein